MADKLSGRSAACFFVDSPEQRRMGVRDSHALALADWMGTAAFDRTEDHWPRQWAEAYVDFAGGEKRAWLHGMGMRWFPVVGWAERGGYGAIGHGNSVPRFHVTWAPAQAYWNRSCVARVKHRPRVCCSLLSATVSMD